MLVDVLRDVWRAVMPCEPPEYADGRMGSVASGAVRVATFADGRVDFVGMCNTELVRFERPRCCDDDAGGTLDIAVAFFVARCEGEEDCPDCLLALRGRLARCSA